MRQSVLCVTLNPCLDKTLIVPPWTPGQHQVRGRQICQVVGGKGVNVARALRALGRHGVPILPLGGPTGTLCCQLLREDDQLDPLVVRTAAATRVILTVRTEDSADQTAFFDPNPRLTPEDRRGLIELFERHVVARRPAWCVLSGSSPADVTDDLYAQCISLCRQHDVQTLLDTYGNSLHAALQARPDVVKINHAEASTACGDLPRRPADIEQTVNDLFRLSDQAIIITFGRNGAIMNDATSCICLRPGPGKVVNPIGSGDAMAAGWVDARLRGWDHQRSFRWSVAAAADNVRHWTACAIDRDRVDAESKRVVEIQLAELLT